MVGYATERCWIEHEQVPTRGEIVPGRTIAGAVLGGVIGHQIGSGSGSGPTLATAGGAAAGATIGANTGRSDQTQTQTQTRDVRRCEKVPSTVPTFWDLSCRFRGIDHQMQMDSQPGRNSTVNGKGEPRM